MKYYHDEKVARYERRQMNEKKQRRNWSREERNERKNRRIPDEDPLAPPANGPMFDEEEDLEF